MAGTKRPGFWQESEARSASEDCQADIDDALRAIVQALARQAARDVFEEDAPPEPGHDSSEDPP